MDIPNIRRVVHYGVPADIDEYVQETGRAGRDGKLSAAIIIRHRFALSGGVKQEMKDYLSANDGSICRRKLLLGIFGHEATASGSYLCCDICAKLYSCCSCALQLNCLHDQQGCYCVKWCNMLSSIEHQYLKPKEQVPCRIALSHTELESVKVDLLNLRCARKLAPDNINNIYPELIDNVLDNIEFICDISDVMALGAFDHVDAEMILAVIDDYSPLSLNLSFAALNMSSD